MNTLRKMAKVLPELTDVQAATVYAWAQANEDSNALAKAYMQSLTALGCALEIDAGSLSTYFKVNKGASQKLQAKYLLAGAVNPLYELRCVLGNALLQEMKS